MASVSSKFHKISGMNVKCKTVVSVCLFSLLHQEEENAGRIIAYPISHIS